MAVHYLGCGQPDGTVLGRTDDKLAFFGVTTVTSKQAVVATVDSTTVTDCVTTGVTTVDSTTITAVQVATATTTHLITAANRLITDVRLHAVAINSIISRIDTVADVVNTLVADSRSQAVAVNGLITKTRALGLFASS